MQYGYGSLNRKKRHRVCNNNTLKIKWIVKTYKTRTWSAQIAKLAKATLQGSKLNAENMIIVNFKQWKARF